MKSEIKKGVLLNYLSIFLASFIGLVYTPFLVKYLGQSEYGLYSLVNSIIGYMYVLDFGLGSALIVFVSKYKDENNKIIDLYGMFRTIYLIISVITLIAGLILSFSVDNLFGNTMSSLELYKAKILMVILTLNLSLNFYATIYDSIITFNEKFVFQKTASIIATIIKPFMALPILMLGFKSITLSLITTIINIIHIYVNYYYCKKKLKVNVKFNKVNKILLKEVFAYSFFIFLNAVVDKINWNIDQFVLGMVSGTVAVSVYAIASQINSMYLSFSTAISTIMLPKISKIIAKGDAKEIINNEFIKVGRIQYFILFLILTGFIVFGVDFIQLWVGADYYNSYFITLILIVPVTIPLTQNLGISILQAKKMHKFRSLLYLVMAVSNVIISIPLAKLYDGIGSAIGTAISLFVGNVIIMNIYYYKKAKIDIPSFWKNIISITLKEIPPFLFILFLTYFCQMSGYLNLLIFIPIYCIIYILFSYKFVFNEYERGLLIKPLRKIKRLIKWKK